jgi:NAD(P)-dependent dehydrogenase (short-subunit alcohol dehydrogenase family)
MMQRQEEADLSGKVAIITGSSRGIGKQAALVLARRGVNIVVTARTVDPGQNELPGTIGETVAEIEALGAEAIAVGADLAVEEDLERIVQTATDRFGGVDILVNNAAVTADHNMTADPLKLPRSDWLHHFAVNVHAPFTLVQLVAPIMEARGGGRILNVTTGSGEVHRLPEEPRKMESLGGFSLLMPAYYSSKRALDRFANVMTPVLASKNIFIISLMPGLAASPIAVSRVKTAGMDDSLMVPLDVPARMLAYFAACADPAEYAGRIFWAERELAELGLSVDAPVG